MKQSKNKPKKGWIFWTPRIVSIIFILFLALFSLDVFGNDYGFWGTLLAFLMHNIPVFILALALWISWKEKRGWLAGSIFILGGIGYLIQITITSAINGFEWFYLAWALQIALPAFFIGILFLVGWRRKK